MANHRENLSLGPVPYEEDCEQVGTKHYDPDQARFEAKTYRRQLCRLFPDVVDKGLAFRVVTQEHDFGNYFDLEVTFDPSDKEQVHLALGVEDFLPSTWDDEAREELKNYLNKDDIVDIKEIVDNLSPQNRATFHYYLKEAKNWSNCPLFTGDSQENGYLTDWKKKNLVKTEKFEGANGVGFDVFIQFSGEIMDAFPEYFNIEEVQTW